LIFDVKITLKYMKPLFAFITLLTLTSALQAQTLVNENKLWACTMAGSEQPENYESYFIKFSGDSIIDGIEYKKVWRSNDSLQTSWYIDGYIREDSLQRIFFYPINTEYTFSPDNEVMIYNFNIKVGDSLELPFSVNNFVYLDSIGFEKLEPNNDSVKTYYLYSHPNMDIGYLEAKWYENIGSLGGVLAGLNLTSIIGAYFDLTCYFENDSIIYHNNKFSTCFPEGYPDAIVEKDFTESFLTVLNSKDEIVFTLNTGIKEPGIVHFYDLNGTLIFKSQISPEKNAVFSTSQLASGIYIYQFLSHNNNFSGKVAIDK